MPHIVLSSFLRGASGGVPVRRSEAVASPMRLAIAPGRLARPAPPGNDDPCEERRTIPEGMPRLPREAWTQVSDGRFRCLSKRKQRPTKDNGEHGPGPEIPRGAP